MDSVVDLTDVEMYFYRSVAAKEDQESLEYHDIVDLRADIENDGLSADPLVLEGDKNFIESVERIQSYTTIEERKNPEWFYHSKDILWGRYPLEKIPEHIRQLAKELYYDAKDK